MAADFGFKATTEAGYYFISYNTEDADRVGEICRLMNEGGLAIWYDEGIPHDSYWESVLAEKIDNCEEAIFFITKGIFDKGRERKLQDIYTYKEYNLARIYEKKALIVLLDQISPKDDVPYGLMSWWQEINPSIRQGVLAYDVPPDIVKTKIFKALNFSQDRVYMMEDDIKEPLFNSIINHPTRGDEREFIRIRKGGENEWKREIELEAGKQYEVEVFFRNDGNAVYNSSKFNNNTVAVGTKMAIDVPRYVSKPTELTACIMWNPLNKKRTDSILLLPGEGKSKKLKWVIGQAKIYSKWKASESVLPSNLFSFNGTWLGLNKLQGVIPAGDEYSGYVRFFIDVERDIDEESIVVKQEVSIDGVNWKEGRIRAEPNSYITLRTTISNKSTENLAGALYTVKIPENCQLRDRVIVFSNAHLHGYNVASKSFIEDGIEVGIIRSGIMQIITQIKIDAEQNNGLLRIESQLQLLKGAISKCLEVEIGG